MGRVVKDEKEVAQAIKNDVDYIEVEGGIKDFFIRECPAYILLYQFSPKDTGQSKVK